MPLEPNDIDPLVSIIVPTKNQLSMLKRCVETVLSLTAYENYEYNMELVESLFRHVAREAFGKMVFKVAGHDVDFEKPWKRVAMADAVLETTGVDFRTLASLEEAGRPEPLVDAGSGHALYFLLLNAR